MKPPGYMCDKFPFKNAVVKRNLDIKFKTFNITFNSVTYLRKEIKRVPPFV